MFSQRKRFWSSRWFALVIAGLLGFGYWVNQGPEPAPSPDDTNRETGISRPVDTKDPLEARQEEPKPGTTPEQDGASEDAEVQGPFYLIREENRIVSVYYCDEEGNQSFVSHTDIAFDLLSEADQALFSKGIVKQSKEELEELLQDFGS